MQLELNIGIAFAVAAKHRRKLREHTRADVADAEEAGLAAANAAGFGNVLLNRTEGSASAFEEDFAGAGEPDHARGAGEERVAENLFEFANLLREWRLGEMETCGGAAEVEFLGDGDEVAQMAEFQVLIHT